MELNYILIIFTPLLAFLSTAFIILLEIVFSVRINSKLSALLVVGLTSISTTLSLKLFYLKSFATTAPMDYWFNLKYSPWASFLWSGQVDMFSGPFLLRWGVSFDALSITMLLVITFVSLLVQVYAIEYMSHDLSRTRFVGYLGLFVFFMLVLVTSDNFAQLFIGWEGVGLVSYLLINFWFTRVEAARSALKAVGVNKFGDYALVMAMVFIFYLFGTLDYDEVFYFAQFNLDFTVDLFGYSTRAVTLICFFLLVAAVGKSAQLGLHTWLPDAMEGPTPVSALIHAATMVTAGVYLLVRCSPLLEHSPVVLALTAVIGVTTALFGASTALCQNDLKKVIAYSTCSQLGYMVCACGLSAYSAAMFHLTTHAFFKALLFLCAGSVIHAMADEQDMRKMGGLAKILPFTYVAMLIGSLSLGGFPFLAGFYSKDLILELAASTHTYLGLYIFVVGTLGAVFTTLYSVRLIMLTFLTKTNAFRGVIEKAHDAPLLMALPLLILSILSVVGGWLLKPIFISSKGEFNFNFWNASIYVDCHNYLMRTDLHLLAPAIKNIPTLAVFSSFCIAAFFYAFFSSKGASFLLRDQYLPSYFRRESFINTQSLLKEAYYFLNKKWYFDIIYSSYLVKNFYLFCYTFIFKSIDRGVLNFLIWPFGVDVVLFIVGLGKRMHRGLIYTYLLLFLLAISLMIIFFLEI